MTPILRTAGPADADAIAALHVAVYQQAYHTLAPPGVLEALGVPARLKRWREILADENGACATVVAEAGGAIAGFGHCGPPAEPAFGGRGEVRNLYVDQAVARRGIGRKLLANMAEFLHANGHHAIGLGTVVGNDPAIAFYQALGGTIIGTYTTPGPLWRSTNVLFAWDDVPALIRQCHA